MKTNDGLKVIKMSIICVNVADEFDSKAKEPIYS